MPSKKRKYNARFPAGRIKKIMQTDEEVGKVAQAVPIIIYNHVRPTPRTLELFVESLLGKALQVTTARNAKTLSPSHVKQCILGEARFDFLRDLVKNIPDVSAAEEKELQSAESSPNSSRFPEAPRRLREDSNSSSSCDITRVPTTPTTPTHVTATLTHATTTLTHASTREHLKMHLKRHLSEADAKAEPSTSLETNRTQIKVLEPSFPTVDTAIDLSKKITRTANFYQETLVCDDVLPSSSVIKPNPIYTSQPSTSYNITVLEPVRKDIPNLPLPRTPVTPVINIDFSKNLTNPEIKVLDSNIVVPNEKVKVSRQNSKSRIEVRKVEPKPPAKAPVPGQPLDIDSLNSGNLQIDEDYDT